jgi:predicted regulator of amino acid metabolism with ACT domain
MREFKKKHTLELPPNTLASVYGNDPKAVTSTVQMLLDIDNISNKIIILYGREDTQGKHIRLPL